MPRGPCRHCHRYYCLTDYWRAVTDLSQLSEALWVRFVLAMVHASMRREQLAEGGTPTMGEISEDLARFAGLHTTRVRASVRANVRTIIRASARASARANARASARASARTSASARARAPGGRARGGPVGGHAHASSVGDGRAARGSGRAGHANPPQPRRDVPPRSGALAGVRLEGWNREVNLRAEGARGGYEARWVTIDTERESSGAGNAGAGGSNSRVGDPRRR